MDVFGRSGITPGQWLAGQRTRGSGVRASTTGGKWGAFVTGDKELDYFLAQMLPKEVRKAIVKATDATIINHVRPLFIENVEAAGCVGTRAMIDIAKKRRTKRSRVQIGSELFIDREKIIELRRERGGRIGQDKKRGEDFFYPIAIEFGTAHERPERPLLRALLGNTAAALAEFRKYLRAVVTGVKLPGINYGRKFKI